MRRDCINNIQVGDRVGMSFYKDDDGNMRTSLEKDEYYQEFVVIDLSYRNAITIGSSINVDGLFYISRANHTLASTKHYPLPYYYDIYIKSIILKIIKKLV